MGLRDDRSISWRTLVKPAAGRGSAVEYLGYVAWPAIVVGGVFGCPGAVATPLV
jgi:hypothetical protein